MSLVRRMEWRALHELTRPHAQQQLDVAATQQAREGRDHTQLDAMRGVVLQHRAEERPREVADAGRWRKKTLLVASGESRRAASHQTG